MKLGSGRNGETENGKPPGDRWVLALTGGRALIGRDDPLMAGGQTMRLSPVFDLNVAIETQGGGRALVHRRCMPIAMLSSLTAIDLDRLTTPVVAFDELGEMERTQLMAAVQEGIEMQGQMVRSSTVAQSGAPRIIVPGRG